MWLANLGLLVVAFAWGSQIPVLTVLLAHWDPYFLAAVRYVLAVPVLLLLLRLLEPGTPGEMAAATRKLAGEGFKRPWPPLIKMSEDVRPNIEALFSK